MERLTGYIDGGIVLARRLIGDTDWLHAVLDRLASYEDSGLPPERVQELAAAEREGRMIVIPQSRACRECELRDRHAPLIECSALHQRKKCWKAQGEKAAADPENITRTKHYMDLLAKEAGSEAALAKMKEE